MSSFPTMVTCAGGRRGHGHHPVQVHRHLEPEEIDIARLSGPIGLDVGHRAATVTLRASGPPRTGKPSSIGAGISGSEHIGVAGRSRRGSSRRGLVTSEAHGRRALLLRHHADLLRQRGPAPGARVHDDRRRRDGPPPPPARGGRLLPHRDRRARRAGGRRGQGAGPRAQGARRSQRRALQGAGSGARGHERLLHPHLRPRAHQAGAGRPAARLRQRLRPRGPLRGLVLPALRRLQGRQRDRGGQPLPDPPHRARAPQRGELLLRPERLPGAPRGALRRAPRLRDPARPLQRGALVHQERPAGHLALARSADVGRPGPLGHRPRLLRLVRRAAELLHRARLRARRRGSHRAVLAGDLPRHRQGHPALPHRLLAGDADGGRPAACPSTSSSTATC